MTTPWFPDAWLPPVFLGLMGLAMAVYVVLDGYDLGVGMLMSRASGPQRDRMVASIGPFWDANETWLVLGVGLLLIAFPRAHGVVLGALYGPVAVMLLALILRGVAFDFRVKALDRHKPLWNRAFIAGSGLAAAAQGWMLGRYVGGLREGAVFTAFAAVIALALPAAYVLIGACWLVLKTDGELQRRAVRWARLAWPAVVVGLALISAFTPWISPTVRDRWFVWPQFAWLLPIPLASAALLLALRRVLASPRVLGDACAWPFVLATGVFATGFAGLAYSVWPFVVIDRLTMWQAANAPAALRAIGIGVAVTLPVIAGYTVFSYRVFRGKADALSYA
jgi:cytochrome d ubiquinol oxidase subunit II